MGKPTGFMEFERVNCHASSPKSRIKNYNEFHDFLSAEQRAQQDVWTAVFRSVRQVSR